MPRILAVVLLVALMVYALIDCARTPREDVPPGVPKPLWIALILLVPVLGAIAWLVVSRLARSGGTGGGGGGTRRPGPSVPPRRPGPVAPDDDPEFLARLEADRRRAERERRARERGDGEASGSTSDHDGGAGGPHAPEADPRPGSDDDDPAAGAADPSDGGEPGEKA